MPALHDSAADEPLKILLVEDNSEHAELMRKSFESSDSEYSPVFAYSLQTAREFLDSEPPALLITNLVLKDGNGIDLLPGANGPAPHFPTVMLTGHGDQEAAVEAMKAGAVDYLVKSEDIMRDIPNVVDRILADWTKTEEHRQLEDAIHLISEGVLSLTGKEFFNTLVLLLSQVLDVSHTFIARLDKKSQELHTLALAVDGSLQEGFSYDPTGTPTETVLGKKICIYPDSIQELFPEARLLKEMNLESYIGAPLFNSSGNATGVMAALSTSPLPKTRTLHKIMQIFALRAASELERLGAEEELKRSEERYRLIFKSSAEGIMAWDSETLRIRYANPAFCKMLGYSEEELKAQNISVIFSEDCLSDAIDSINDQADGRSDISPDIRLKAKDGRVIYNDIRTSRIEIDGSMHNVAFFSDVTLRKLAEVQKEQLIQADKLSSLGTLVAGVAHEINNPNTFIMLNVPNVMDMWDEMIPALEKYCDERGDESLGDFDLSTIKDLGPRLITDILKGSKRIKNIVSELKDFSGEHKTDAEEDVEINTIVKSSVSLTWNKIKNSTHNFSQDYAEDIPLVRGNSQRIEQVIINLLINACEAMSDPNQALKVSTSHNENSVLIAVTDEGAGMDEATLARITDPFFTTKRDEGGTGLGLAISSKVVSEHGGALRFTSEEGKGTTAEISLPCKHADEHTLQSEQKHVEE